MLVMLLTLFAGPRGFVAKKPAPTQGASVWGVFVGVSAHPSPGLRLRYAARDAEALHAFYVKNLRGAVPADHFTLLTNGRATRAGLLLALKEVLRRSLDGDLIVLSLSMHGVADTDGEVSFVTHDADPTDLDVSAVSQGDLLRLLKRARERKVVLLIDACHAGGFGQPLVAMRSANAAEVTRMLQGLGARGRTTPRDALAVLSSSSSAEMSAEGPAFGGGHGAFTACLLEALTGDGDVNADGVVAIREAFDHTYACVRRGTRGAQSPSIMGHFDGDLPIAFGAGRAIGALGAAPVAPEAPALEPEDTRWVQAQLELHEIQRLEADDAQALVVGCKSGDLVRCIVLGDLYAREGNPTKASGYYARACEGEKAIGCSRLGALRLMGKGVASDAPSARTLLRGACDRGAMDACHTLGWMHQMGIAVGQSSEAASKLWDTACTRGMFAACSSLGDLYTRGLGVQRDQRRAEQLFERACTGGDSGGCERITGAARAARR
jgi:hypothetical protein